MRVSILLGLLICGASISHGAVLTEFTPNGQNEVKDEVLGFRIAENGRDVIQATLVVSQVDYSRWRHEGILVADWSACVTPETAAGSGELTQCLRRSALALDGEGDQIAPGRLELRVHNKTTVSVLLEMQTLDSPVCVIASPDKATAGALKKFAKHSSTSDESDNDNDEPCGGRGVQRASIFPASPKVNQPATISSTNKSIAAPAIKVATVDDSSLGFLFFGDTGTGEPPQYKVANAITNFCRNTRCELTTLLGDNIYMSGVSSEQDNQFQTKFERPYAGLSMPFFVALGNHDHRGNVMAQVNYSKISQKWKMPGRYYSFKSGPAEFFVIDSQDLDTTQVKWIDAQVAASQAKWKIVYGHKPVWSYGAWGGTPLLIRKLMPIMKKYKVDFYISGHDHDKQLIFRDNMYFLISGAGAKTRDVSRGRGTQFLSMKTGFGHMYLHDNVAEVRFVDADGNIEFTKMIPKASPTSTSH